MVVMPPKELNGLVRIANGEFTLGDSANNEQRAIFLDWVKGLTDEELADVIDAKYGSFECVAENDMDDPYIIELLDRASRGEAQC